MQIRTRLTLQFLLLGGMIMIISSVAIYMSSAGFRKEDFYNRLRNKARLTARIVLNADKSITDELRKIDRDYPASLQNEKIVVLNFLNDTIYNTDKKKEITFRPDILEKIRLYQRVYFTINDYEVIGTLYTNSGFRYVIIAAAKDPEGIAHLKKLRLILIAVCLISLLLFYIAGLFFAGKALKPVADVVKQVSDITINKMNLRVNEGNGTDEFGRLARTFNDMLERLESSFASQKDFIANASHELRTPLTSINGQIEVLLMKDRSSDEYKAALTSVLEDLKSIIDLANRLLLIARTSSDTPVSFSKDIRVDDILWQIRDEMNRYGKNCNIQIIMDESLTDSDQMKIAGDESLIRTAFSNIIENACKFSADNSVYISFKGTEKSIMVIFKDKGIGIPENDLKKIFEPFFRAENAISIPGSGIGLPLVSQIIKKHKGEVKISSKPGLGTTVTVSLPLNTNSNQADIN
jgi:signal transduction histidine kinase